MKKIMIFSLLIMLAGTVYFFVQLEYKEEVKTVVHDHSADLSREVGRKKTYQDAYTDLDLEWPFHEISNNQIANLIKFSLPLNPWMTNPDSIYFGKDTITWNYIAMGLGKRNPRFEVTKNHPMWIIAKEILQYNSYLWDQGVTPKVRKK